MPGRSGEGRPDLDGDFGPLLLLIGRRGSWQQQKDDRAHDQGSGEENLHVPLRDAQHPLGKASRAGEAEGREKVEARRLVHQRRHQRGRGEGGRRSFRPLRRMRASFPPSGSAPGSRSPRGAEPGSLTGRAETRARGWLPRYSGLMGSPARPPTGRGSAEGGAHSRRTRIGFLKRLQTPVCRAAHPGTVCFCGSGNHSADTLLGSPR